MINMSRYRRIKVEIVLKKTATESDQDALLNEIQKLENDNVEVMVSDTDWIVN